MLGLRRILDWIVENVKPMRLSRQKTLAAIVHSALHLRGIGVLSLGRGLPGDTSPKHGIKRVWRFFRNGQLETDSLQLSLAHLLAPRNAPVVILLDWTVYGPFQTLAAALPRDGRAMPIWWKTIYVKSGEGGMKTVEREALWAIREMFPFRQDLILIADRGFGNTRWISDIRKWGWGFADFRLASPEREDRRWCVLVLAYIFLSAFGALAEKSGLDRRIRQDTAYDRAMNLARLGAVVLTVTVYPIAHALIALNDIPP